MIGWIRSRIAWRRMQRAFAQQEAVAAARHGRVNDVRARRQAIVNAALAAGRNKEVRT